MINTNNLHNETSPYLLQHADNPVHWQPWNEETLAAAKAENKPLLISIGYSACHWCHVMEHESFEDKQVAQVMNESFVCIKVDREERPDVDQVYMDAVQLMTGQGGWPLNCFALPDGRPFFGGTYFPKQRWVQVLNSVSETFQNDHEKVVEYAQKLTSGLEQMDDLPVRPIPDEFNDEAVEVAVSRWKKRFDHENGGTNGAPKFPLPNNLNFLLNYAQQEGDPEVNSYVQLTLTKMAFGGIYDQIGGGFARYSTDERWKVPHFEKMLYDNGQLLSLYASAYKVYKLDIFKDVLLETSGFIRREMQAENGAFYSALDADSEGEEGKFYVWSDSEVEQLAGKNQKLINRYYNFSEDEKWEGSFIPFREDFDSIIAKEFSMTEAEVQDILRAFNKSALEARTARQRPGLDDKTLTSWNALTAKGLIDAYVATKEDFMLDMAQKNLNFLLHTQIKNNGGLWHSYKNGQSSINGYLEDYAHLIDALLRMYEVTFEQEYFVKAVDLSNYVRENFEQNESGLFYFKDKNDPALIAKKAEVTDNVIPSSNSVLATALFKIGQVTGDANLTELIKKQVASIEPQFTSYPSGYSQWMQLMLYVAEPYYEVVVVGEDCEQKRDALLEAYLPNALICGGKHEGDIAILKGRAKEGKTLIYVCNNGACQLPVSEIDEAFDQMR